MRRLRPGEACVGGLLAIIFGLGAVGEHAGFSNLWDHRGVMPHGLGQALLAFQIVVFAYQGVELIGMAAAETRDREKVLLRRSTASRGGSACSMSARWSS